MTNFLLPAVLGVVALLYILMPLWAGESARTLRPSEVIVYGVEELDLDHTLGKIDEDEWKALRPALLAQATPVHRKTSVESLIRSFRVAKRAGLAVEAEVLIVRGRRRNTSNKTP